MPALQGKGSTNAFTETVKGVGPGAAALFATKAFKAMSQEEKLKTFLELELHKVHLVPEGKKRRTGPGPDHYQGPETTKEEKIQLLSPAEMFAADAFLEVGGFSALNHGSQAWAFTKKPPKPVPMKQVCNGLRHLRHEEMSGLKNQRRNQETCQQLFKKGWVQQPFRVIRGMDYMYNQQQAKAMRMALDAGEEGEDGEDADADVAAARYQTIEEKLRKATFFKDMERQKKGIIHKLAKVSRIHEECAGQVLFRQGDRAAGVYLLTQGSSAVLVRDPSKPETPRQKDVKGLSTLTQVRQEAKTESRRGAWEYRPPQELGRSETKRQTEISEMSAKIHEKIAPKQKILRRDLSSSAQGAQAYVTVEGGNTFTEDSKLGVQVNVIEAGSVFGEVALLSDAPRSASIKCLEDCEFVAVKASTFRKVLAEFTDVARACGVLQSVDTFNRLEERTPGIIHTLAKTAEFSKEAKGQVIFRQGDPGKGCFMLVKGQVTVHVRKGAKGHRWPPTPRMAGGDMPTLTEWRRSGLEAFDDASRREELKYGRPPREEQSFRTTEGFSTFGKESNYGDMVKWLREGTLFGELALQNTEPRSATIVCSQDCELLRLRKEDYLNVIQGTKQKIYFFDRFLAPFRHNADKRAQGALTQHPSLLFADEIVRDGQTLTTEGMYADPKIFVLGASSRVEFCRYKDPGDNPAYILSKRPQSAPNQKANRCQPLLPGDLERCEPDEELRQSITTFNPNGQEVVVYDMIKEGSIFATMSACLNCSPEPFSIVARCPNETCTIYTLDGAGIQKMHPRLLEALRELLAEEGARRMKKVQRDEKIQDVNVGSVKIW